MVHSKALSNVDFYFMCRDKCLLFISDWGKGHIHLHKNISKS